MYQFNKLKKKMVDKIKYFKQKELLKNKNI